jgi:hypothetical protein
MRYLEKIQNLLPLGYLYLIVLGLLSETLFYYPLGINILSYSSITDVLISPISTMTANLIVFVTIVAIFVILFIMMQVLIKYSDTNWAQKIFWKSRISPGAGKQEKQKAALPGFALLVAYMLLSFFVGLGLGGGLMLSKRIRQNKYSYNYKLTLNSGKIEEVYMFDQNSAYYFYVTKENHNIRIAPVGSIGGLELINNKKLK